ncbi:MAG: hypothetical protein KGJ49_04930 [Alphaproteobacteria bacterium]|nr:hypothetical protein [Alphaproteobacteria bacterium]
MGKLIWRAGGIGVFVALAVAAFFVLIPSGDTLRQEAINQASITPHAAVDAQLAQDLGDNNLNVSLYARWEDIYEFAVTAKEGGGVEVIARLMNDGHFSILWQGQDGPPCSVVEKYNIPIGIARYCLQQNVTVDRSSIFHFM